MAHRLIPKELARRLQRGDALTLIDVREPEEFKIANLGGKNIPMGELTKRIDEISREEEIVVICHHGIRSAHAAAFLRQQGFTKVTDLVGGIDRWSEEVDPKVPRY